ncbi:hypothetical protein [Streptococcus suis]|uniref:DUF5648 domain-containing protein n=1 Tax=Streptococcus suis TaxID=1307 RepID=A0AAW5LWB3_STRSU|nr:hypothetical protein [Streptococcus suis]MCR1232298.1 hypothetical protein [Streptococcus suis]HEM6534187.1 hypothetical protein [Streptococcus suis]HEM6560253.1 hypothetical protein [Streptococcus suis]
MKKIFLGLATASLCLLAIRSVSISAEETVSSVYTVNQTGSALESVATFTGYEYVGLPLELTVGQVGQVKRPMEHYLAKTQYSFTLESSDPSVLSFNENGEWIALKSGKTIIKFGVSDPSKNPKFSNELKQLGLSTNWRIQEIYMEPVTVTVSNATNAMYRLYNPNSGEHFYTAALGEKNYLSAIGWHFEGIGWNAPVVGEPVYRLYNPNNGDHHYTTSKGEHDILVTLGWRSENIGWQSGGTIPVYRLYNPNTLGAGSHHYTTSKGEADYLDSIGWNYEGIGWYAE